jgi:hypothetical protein
MWPPESSGTWADWIAGIATAAAVILALIELSQARRASARVRERAQASEVSAWFESVTISYPNARDRPKASSLTSIDDAMIVSNGSKSPIYDVLLRMEEATIPASDTTDLSDSVPYYLRLLAVVPPGVHRLPIDLGARDRSFVPSVCVAFRDSNGRHWFRDNLGTLKRERTDVFTRHNIDRRSMAYDELRAPTRAQVEERRKWPAQDHD